MLRWIQALYCYRDEFISHQLNSGCFSLLHRLKSREPFFIGWSLWPLLELLVVSPVQAGLGCMSPANWALECWASSFSFKIYHLIIQRLRHQWNQGTVRNSYFQLRDKRWTAGSWAAITVELHLRTATKTSEILLASDDHSPQSLSATSVRFV